MSKKRLWAMGLVTDGIWLMTDSYDPDVNEMLKTELPGPARWNREHGRWQFPIHWDTCTGARRVANKFGADLKVSASLEEWAKEERKRIDLIPNVNSMSLVDLPKVKAEFPSLATAMESRPFQTVGAAFAARNRSCLIADQPGLGKTLQSIAAVVEAGTTGPILVVAPKAASQLTWPQELARWAPGDVVVVIGDNMKPAERKRELHRVKNYTMQVAGGLQQRVWVITSPYYLRIRAETDQYQNYVYGPDKKKIINPVGSALMEFFEIEWSAVIVDESHQTLAGATGNKKKQSAQRLGLGALNIREGGLRIALSGTPFRGKESYLWGQLNFLRPDLFRSYRRWVKKHFITWFDGFGWQTGNVKDRAAMYKEAANVMIRRTKEEVAKDLPAKQYPGWPLDADDPHSPVAVWLDMVPKQRTAYNQIIKEASADLDGGELMITGVLAELTRLKQFAGSYGKLVDGEFVPTLPSNKFDWLCEFLDERGIGKDILSYDRMPEDIPKVVVTSQFSQLIGCFAEGLAALGIKSHVFTGDTPQAKREAIKDDWQNNSGSSTRVLFLTTTAGGVSLTLDAADEMVVLDETWNPDDQEQVEDRLHRLSRIHQVLIWKVFSRNTIEEGIYRNNLNSEASLKAIMDGERGRDFMKKFTTGAKVA